MTARQFADSRLDAARERKRIVLEMIAATDAIPRFPDEVATLGTPGPSLGQGADGETHYFIVDASPALYFRIRWAEGGLWLERAETDEWVDDPSLLDYFVGREHGAREIAAAIGLSESDSTETGIG